MKNIASYVASLDQKHKLYDQLLSEKQAAIADFDQRIAEVQKHIGTSAIVGRIAKALKQKFGYDRADVLGPFGLGSQTSIHLYKKKGDSIDKVKSITFELRYGYDGSKTKLSYVDYSRSLERFAPNTIGELNGGNYITKDAGDLTIDQLHALILKINRPARTSKV